MTSSAAPARGAASLPKSDDVIRGPAKLRFAATSREVTGSRARSAQNLGGSGDVHPRRGGQAQTASQPCPMTSTGSRRARGTEVSAAPVTFVLRSPAAKPKPCLGHVP
jgi:hypothetical protein